MVVWKDKEDRTFSASNCITSNSLKAVCSWMLMGGASRWWTNVRAIQQCAIALANCLFVSVRIVYLYRSGFFYYNPLPRHCDWCETANIQENACYFFLPMSILFDNDFDIFSSVAEKFNIRRISASEMIPLRFTDDVWYAANPMIKNVLCELQSFPRLL